MKWQFCRGGDTIATSNQEVTKSRLPIRVGALRQVGDGVGRIGWCADR